MDLTLTAAAPFSLAAVVQSHGWVQLPPFRREEGGFSYVARLHDHHLLAVYVQEAENGVRVSVDGELEAAHKRELLTQVSWMVGLDQDLSSFYRLVRDHARLSHVVTQSRGRLLRSATLFEDVVKTILTTNTSWAGTIRMAENLVSQFGSALAIEEPRHAFPTPQQVAEADEATLRRETGLGYRAPYVLELARSVAAGDLNLEALKRSELSTEAVRKVLLSIKGVGDYAAANLLLILGRYDHIPIDSWALRVVSQEWHDGEPIGPAEVEAAFEEWGEWKGLVYWFWQWSESA